MSIEYDGKYKLPKTTDEELVEYLVECYMCNCVFNYEEYSGGTVQECPECSAPWHQ